MAAGLGISGQTVPRYLDLLVDLLLVRRLTPWTSNLGKRLVRSPKIYVRDTGIAHALLGIPNSEILLGHPVVGASWESFVIENLVAAAPSHAEPFFFRTSSGSEVDLLIAFAPDRIWAIEIKRSLSPKPAKGFHYACQYLNPERSFVVYPGEERFRVSEKIEAISLLDLSREIRSQ